MERVGVLGLGRMGREIARRLAEDGSAVTGWTRSGLSADEARALGVTMAQRPADVAVASDVLILSLFDDSAVRDVLTTLFDSDLSGKLIADTSTVSPMLLRNMQAQAHAAGVALVDAPISGGPEMVANGSCAVFLGGAPGDVARAEPVLARFAGRVIRTGALGTGMGLKVVNNATLAGTFATLSETLSIAKRAGLDFELVLRALAGGPAGPPWLGARLDRILGLDDSVGFSIDGAAKDLAVCRGSAAELGIDVPVLDRMAALTAVAQEEGLGERDLAAVLSTAWARA